jgi:pimeloyl-ACP methyl ester carboxylesterase
MKQTIIIISTVLSILLISNPCFSQNDPYRVLIESSGFKMVAHIYSGSTDSPRPTVILVPGWGGGKKDVLGLGSGLSQLWINVVVFAPRGWHDSEGIATFANGLEDIGAVWKWFQIPENIESYCGDRERLVLGGHSWGGGMSLAYAAIDSGVKRVFSISGTDHGQFIRHYQQDEQFSKMIDKALAGTKAPEGPILFELSETLRELAENQDAYGLIENASNLSNRSILLIGGWEDMNVTIDNMLLPFYRALKAAGTSDVTFMAYHATHGFNSVRDRLTKDLYRWILQ